MKKTYTIHTVTDQKEWDNFVTNRHEANFLHAWQWGEFHIARGKTVFRRGVYHGDTLVALWLGVLETARRGSHIAVAGGPLGDWGDKRLLETVRDDMITQANQANAVFLRVRPQEEATIERLQQMRELGFAKAPMYLSVEHAGILDLTKSEDEILGGMRQRLRRALRKAAKNDITVTTSTDPADVAEFYQIQLQTARRHDFVSFSEDFLQKQFAAFAHTGNAVLYTARHEGEILAQNFMIFYGNEASYHYGVSTEKGTRLSGAPLLHMQAMRDARERGITRYNFWGIVGEEETNHRFYGVSVFKRGFGVDELKYVPAHDLVLDKKRYLLTWAVETARRKWRKV